MSDVAISCIGLTKHYRRGFGVFRAVEGLDLSIPRGALFGLLGPNGAGKTTTIMMLLGLVHPTAGSVRLLGGRISEKTVRRQIGYVPEKFQLPAFLSAREFLEIQGGLLGLKGPDLKLQVEQCLEMVGLAARREDRAGGFSKGMQQRLVLAQALLGEPALLILDEPTSALDPAGRKDVRELIRATHARGATVVLNSHLLFEVEAVCDQVAILRGGQLVSQGAVNALTAQTLRVEARIGNWGDGVASAIARLASPSTLKEFSDGPPMTIQFEVASEQVLPRVASAIIEAGGEIYTLAPHSESLEDVFLRLMEEPA